MSDLEASFEAQMKAAFESSERKVDKKINFLDGRLLKYNFFILDFTQISDLESFHKTQLESAKSLQNANVVKLYYRALYFMFSKHKHNY